jgi:predicted 3-demethylubiquinone-9 3-methyltransferase (glyoxalase superfamily)
MTKFSKIFPSLWCNNNGEEAARFYTSIFKNSKIIGTSRYCEAAARATGNTKGSTLTVLFELEGQTFMALNGGDHFKFTPAISFFVWCENEAEIQHFWKNFSAGGQTRIPLDKYPFAEKYGWIEDKYGVSWQLMVSPQRPKQKISPALLFTQEHARKSEEAMKLYTSLFENSKINSIARDPKGEVVLHARFDLAGQSFVAMESPIPRDFTFNPAVSLSVNCDTQKEIDHYWNGLTAEPDFEQCGWLRDRFGISWQIVPSMMNEILLGNDEAKIERVTEAYIQMGKFDLETIKKAAQG